MDWLTASGSAGLGPCMGSGQGGTGRGLTAACVLQGGPAQGSEEAWCSRGVAGGEGGPGVAPGASGWGALRLGGAGGSWVQALWPPPQGTARLTLDKEGRPQSWGWENSPAKCVRRLKAVKGTPGCLQLWGSICKQLGSEGAHSTGGRAQRSLGKRPATAGGTGLRSEEAVCRGPAAPP